MNNDKKEKYVTMKEAVEIIKPFNIKTLEEYKDFVRANPHLRLPLRPNIYYTYNE